MGSPFDVSSEQACGFEHTHVLRDGRQGHVERLRQLTHGGRRPREPFEDGAARRVREGSERRVQSGRSLVNHMVKIRGTTSRVKHVWRVALESARSADAQTALAQGLSLRSGS
jgi:hypothetical protein